MKCGYALRGQPVFEEQHYGWAVVRCPECGLVAPMHGFHASRRAANITTGMLSVVWTAVALAIVGGLGGLLTLFVSIAFRRGYVGEEVRQWTGRTVRQTWNDADSILGVLVLLMFIPLAVPPATLFMAMTAGRGRRATLMLPAAVGVVALLLFGAIYWVAYVDTRRGWGGDFQEAVTSVAGMMLWLGATLVMTLLLSGVCLLSRRGLRWVVGHVGPNWLVLALSGLWTEAGKPLPGRVREAD
jgi:heme/copper-type cytochrome/quinol oxidase subunit 4